MFARKCGYSKAGRDLPVPALEVHTNGFYEYQRIMCSLHDADCCTDGTLVVLCCVIKPPLIAGHHSDVFGHLCVRVVLSHGVSECVVCG